MYIISKHKDYYDGVVGSVGIDKTIVYDRTLKELTKEEYPKEFQNKRDWQNVNHFHRVSYGNTIKREKCNEYESVEGFIIGFCGKLNLGWKLTKRINKFDLSYDRHLSTTETFITFDIELVESIIYTENYHGKFNEIVDYIINFNALPLFRELNSPIFVFDSIGRNSFQFIVNPILKEYDFFRVVDSFTAFQELQMFIGGVLGTGQKEIIEVEDKYKIEQHGFDKWSFRKEPKKWKKKLKK